MRRAITFVVVGDSYKLVSGPEVPVAEQLAKLKEARCKTEMEGVDRVEVWTSNGSVKVAKFKKRPAAATSSSEQSTASEETGDPNPSASSAPDPAEPKPEKPIRKKSENETSK